jgi:2-polyprenyl-3-methyl-5-hydroxy-6-metoxy-1,4-benzoquinol methylase
VTQAARWHEFCPVCGHPRLEPMPRYIRAHLVRCADCGLTFSSLSPSGAELDAHYRDYGHWRDSPITRQRYRELLETFKPYRHKNKLLDIGCGAGMFLEEARARGWGVHGTEFGEGPLALARSRGLDVVQAPIRLETFPADSFDVVTAFEVFEHVRDPSHEVAVIANVLRPGGLLYCTTPNFNSLSRRVLGPRWSIIEYPEHLWYFTARTIREWLGRFGFVAEKIWSSGVSVTRIRESLPSSMGDAAPATCEDEHVRQTIESSRLLRLAKTTVNGVLSALDAGDTLKARFRLVGYRNAVG